MTVEEIVIEYLRANGYDGLWVDDCGCFIDDLFPCAQCFSNCQPGYRVENPNRSEGGWMISPDPPEKGAEDEQP